MKKLLTIVLAWASLALMFTFVAAGSFRGDPSNDMVTEADVLPAYEIITTVRSMGLRPSGEPERRGPYYILHATDARGTELRVVADAKFGDILSVAPALNGSQPQYQRGPHIIQVPQAGQTPQPAARASTQASVNHRTAPGAVDDDDDDDDDRAVPPAQPRLEYPAPRRELRWQPRSETAPRQPAEPRRAVLSAPVEGPTPIRPTPQFSGKPDPAGKFGAQQDSRANTPPPPPGYTAPSALPHQTDPQ